MRLTDDRPGSGGRLTRETEDFEVHEFLPYALAGEGEHAFLRIRKRGLDTLAAARRLVAHLGVGEGPRLPRDLGIAGLKDRWAVAEQWMSLPWPADRALPPPGPVGPEVELLEAVRHRHKLRKGHVATNRFRVIVRDVPPGGLNRAEAVLEALRSRGVPHRFGPQRFGADGDNAHRARAILAGRERAPRERRLAGLLMSALQSELFNRALDLRLAEGAFGRALDGDRMVKHATGGQFWVDDPDTETPRVARLEISPMARMPGRKLAALRGEAARIEAAALEAAAVDPSWLPRLGVGVFRAIRYPLDEGRVEPVDGVPDAYRVILRLPAGAYATVVLDELVKPADGPLRRVSVDAPGEAP